MSWWVSLLGEAEDEADDAWREKKVRERRNREKWEFEGQNGFIFEAVKGVGVWRERERERERESEFKGVKSLSKEGKSI
jgi:hypothetical protein